MLSAMYQVLLNANTSCASRSVKLITMYCTDSSAKIDVCVSVERYWD